MPKPNFPIVPHSETGDPDCCGSIVPDIRGDIAAVVCNECGLVFATDVPRTDVNARLAKLAPIAEATSERRPHCGAECVPALLVYQRVRVSGVR